ncbi:MAG TPA: prepilin-type N-terminal cleavage/methylation domain-containing protein [Candidatus Magasanikbacteria bacterium]|nr:prepilin-type N-terminal cleavage/methylation domain-containing protein [Candidatus Magasanikbacteria bacterium]
MFTKISKLKKFILKRNLNNSGFTLLELLVAIAIFLWLFLGSSWFIIHGLRYNAIIWEQLTTQNEGRQAIQNFVDDIRRAEESSLGAYAIAKANNYEIIFYANIDVDHSKERVRYWLENGTLKKGVTKPSGNPLTYSNDNEIVKELAHNVVNLEKNVPIFQYFDQNYSGTQSPLAQPVRVIDVRVVKIQLELEKDPTESPVPLHIEGLGQIRNLKMN